jgi:pimeloyl-ACP methyl ester carboxylesterase
MLHDGLGSIAQWRDIPEQVATATGRSVLAYNRRGHGRSTPPLTGPHQTLWLEHEADVTLPQLLDNFDLGPVALVGHSDGASIALLHASRSDAVEAVVALATHTFVEPICAGGIAAMRADPGRLVKLLGRYHDDPAGVFEAWSGVWVTDDFGRWDCRERLASIVCPTWIVQGSDDEYATADQVLTTVAAIGSNATAEFVDECGHVMHHDQPAAVLKVIVRALAL